MQDLSKPVYRVKEVAEILGVSGITVIRRFQNEHGVIVFEGKQRKRLRIPRHVLERVITRMSVK